MPEVGTEVAMAVAVTEYTDPGCPWAYAAEPHRWRLLWLYGAHGLPWRRRMVVLARSPLDYVEKGFTPERQAAVFELIATEHGMPIDARRRPRVAATLPACRAVVAARLNAPEKEAALLRRLRLRHFGGELLDEPGTIAAAARDVGIEGDDLGRWMNDPDVVAALEEDAAAARRPSPPARALDHELANWSGGLRSSCPTYEISRAGDQAVTIAIPGFQPFAVYDVVMANLRPDLARRDDPSSVEEVLAWAGEPLATQEVAGVCAISTDEAREQLDRVARGHPLGNDALWTLPED